MGQNIICSIKSPILYLLQYQIGSIDDVITLNEIIIDDDNDVIALNELVDDIEKEKEENRMKRMKYERQLSKEINDYHIRKTRKEILFPLIQSIYPNLNVPMEILDIILDYEQNDSLIEIFGLFDTIKTRIITSIYIIPYIIGWIQLIIFGYLSSEYWKHTKSEWHHLLIIQIMGIILLITSIIQLIGCSFCVS